VVLQVGALQLQDRLGSRFFIPKRFLPPKYDYHRPLPPSFGGMGGSVRVRGADGAGGDEVDESEVSPLNSTSNDLETGLSPECAICYTSIDPGLHDYMLTPCEHLFHTGCLGRWMDIKLECPSCRAALPPA
jgi:hypothetical protein